MPSTPGLISNFSGAFGNTITNDPLVDQTTHAFLGSIGNAPFVATASSTLIGNGTTDNSILITIAETLYDSFIPPVGTYLFSSNVTITKSWLLRKGVTFLPGPGVTITFTGPIEAGPYQIFDLTQVGFIRGLRTSRPEWFGAVADGITIRSDDGMGGCSIPTVGSSTLTNNTTGATFPDSIVGMNFCIPGVGYAGGVLASPVTLPTDTTMTLVDASMFSFPTTTLAADKDLPDPTSSVQVVSTAGFPTQGSVTMTDPGTLQTTDFSYIGLDATHLLGIQSGDDHTGPSPWPIGCTIRLNRRTLLVGDQFVRVNAVSVNTLAIERGGRGTVAAGASVTEYSASTRLLGTVAAKLSATSVQLSAPTLAVLTNGLVDFWRTDSGKALRDTVDSTADFGTIKLSPGIYYGSKGSNNGVVYINNRRGLRFICIDGSSGIGLIPNSICVSDTHVISLRRSNGIEFGNGITVMGSAATIQTPSEQMHGVNWDTCKDGKYLGDTRECIGDNLRFIGANASGGSPIIWTERIYIGPGSHKNAERVALSFQRFTRYVHFDDPQVDINVMGSGGAFHFEPTSLGAPTDITVIGGVFKNRDSNAGTVLIYGVSSSDTTKNVKLIGTLIDGGYFECQHVEDISLIDVTLIGGIRRAAFLAQRRVSGLTVRGGKYEGNYPGSPVIQVLGSSPALEPIRVDIDTQVIDNVGGGGYRIYDCSKPRIKGTCQGLGTQTLTYTSIGTSGGFPAFLGVTGGVGVLPNKTTLNQGGVGAPTTVRTQVTLPTDTILVTSTAGYAASGTLTVGVGIGTDLRLTGIVAGSHKQWDVRVRAENFAVGSKWSVNNTANIFEQPILELTTIDTNATPSTSFGSWLETPGSGSANWWLNGRMTSLIDDTAITPLFHHSSVPYYIVSGNKGSIIQVVCTGTPEGVVVAPIGSSAYRTDGAAATCWYRKETGTGNTGWVAIP